jgi:hypothetical protein
MKRKVICFALALLFLGSCDYEPKGNNTKNNTNTGVEDLKMDKDSTLKEVPG